MGRFSDFFEPVISVRQGKERISYIPTLGVMDFFVDVVSRSVFR